MQNDIAEIKLRAERRIGEFSRELPKGENYNRGNQYKMATPHDGEQPSKTSILKDADITHPDTVRLIAYLKRILGV